MQILDGKIASQALKDQLKHQVESLKKENKRPPHLVAILVGNDGASETYVASKVRNCEAIGFTSTLIRMENSVEELKLLSTIYSLNEDDGVDGILVQLPLPKQVNEHYIINAIHPSKDVDGFHPENVGKMVQGFPSFIPATPLGIILMLAYYNIATKGKHAVVIGRSNIVGRPMSILLGSNQPYGNCTVTLCHRHTENLKAFTINADILVAAVGIPDYITADMVKPGAVIIDVGITRVDDLTAKKGYVIKGDVKFEEVSQKAGALTPVPGGVGLMTIAGLLQNTMQAYLKKQKL